MLVRIGKQDGPSRIFVGLVIPITYISLYSQTRAFGENIKYLVCIRDGY